MHKIGKNLSFRPCIVLDWKNKSIKCNIIITCLKNSCRKLVRQTGATLVNQDAAAASSDIILIAVGRDYYDQLPFQLLKGKTLIDVSNNTEKRRGPQ